MEHCCLLDESNIREGLSSGSGHRVMIPSAGETANFLEPVCKIGKEENGSKGNHGREVSCPLFIASGNASELLEAIDESFHNIPLSIVLFVERASAPFVAASSNGAANMITMEITSQGSTGVAFVCHQASGS
jgi:hypothetical protein